MASGYHLCVRGVGKSAHEARKLTEASRDTCASVHSLRERALGPLPLYSSDFACSSHLIWVETGIYMCMKMRLL